MKIQMFIDSDTCLEFKSRAQAFIYCDKNNITGYCLLSTYEENGRVSVYNSFLAGDPIEYFPNEYSALKYISSFL